MNISGKVRIEVVITPDGHVQAVLASSAAIRFWCRPVRMLSRNGDIEAAPEETDTDRGI